MWFISDATKGKARKGLPRVFRKSFYKLSFFKTRDVHAPADHIQSPASTALLLPPLPAGVRVTVLRLLKIAGTVTATAIGAFLALVLIAPLFISSEAMRHAVAVHLSSLTGQSVTIDGDTSFRPLPSPRIRLSRIQIGGEDDSTPLLESGGVEAHISLGALLFRRIDITGLTLTAPRILLTVSSDGKSNWRTGSSILSLLDPSRQNGGYQNHIRLGEITLRDGVISYQDNQAERRSEISDVNMVISWPDLESSLRGSGTFIMRGEKVALEGSLNQPSGLFRRQISPFNLNFETKALNWQITGDAFSARDIQLEGKLAFSSSSMQQLSAWLVPELRGGPNTGPVQGTAKLRIADRTLTLGGMKMSVDKSKGEGYLALTFDKTRTGVQGTLDFDEADIGPYLNTQMPNPATLGNPAAAAPGNLDADKLRADRLGPVDVDLRLSAARLAAGKLVIREAALSVLSRDGRVEMSLADGAIYGGRIAARVSTLARAAGGVRVNSLLSLTNVTVDDPLRELLGIVRLTGTGSFSLDLTGEGETLADIGQSLRGDASLRFGPGSMTGLDLGSLIKRAERNPVEALLEARGGRTAIESATGTFRIMDGKASTDNFTVRGTGYQVTIKGGTDVATRNLSFAGSLSAPSADPAKPGLELPFVIRGPWSDPIVVPNPEALMRRAAPQQ